MDPLTTNAVAPSTSEGVLGGFLANKPVEPLRANLEHITCSKPIPRSSHSLVVINDQAYLFGGEIKPRQPVSNDVEVLQISSSIKTNITLKSIAAKAIEGSEDVPAARVGHTATAARNRMFVFGGRGGAEMTALSESGRLWVYDTETSTWLFLDPPPNTDYPCARSYHASTASEDSNAIFIHAGCASDGSRLIDTWAFYLDEGKWTRLADAPGPGRGGPALAYGCHKLWRFGGFDGTTELGGQLDYLELPPASTLGYPSAEITRTEWKSLPFETPGSNETSSPSVPTPANRSLAALHYTTSSNGHDYLILTLGEGNPSTIGHAGAGKFFQDIWAYQLPSTSGLVSKVSGIAQAIKEHVPGLNSTGLKGHWTELSVTSLDPAMRGDNTTDNETSQWTGRAWFDSAMVGTNGILLWGGIDEQNERLNDGWMITIA